MNRIAWLVIFLFALCFINKGYSQHMEQDVEFHTNAHLLTGKKILKVKRDFNDPYVWVLAQNKEVYRVNSLTLATDDYTAKFAAYNNFQFIDIAGLSKDTVFIATNSTNVIQYRSGAVGVIGASKGIKGTVNSVGITNGSIFALRYNSLSLIVGTDNGFFNFDPATGKSLSQTDNSSSSRIYEATYRTELYKDSSSATSDFVDGDTIQYQPVRYRPGDGSMWIHFLWEGGKEFGYNIRTANAVNNDLYGGNGVFTDLFWGNSQGMFQIYGDYSYYSIYFPAYHYLNGIGVNKITNMYGLAAFGDQNTHQNLLVGTEKGFYFSSNIYAYGPIYMHVFSLFHDDELGNIVINDISVNTSSTVIPICEDGVWLGTDDGLYLVKPDYAKFLNSKTTKAISFVNQPDTLAAIKVCAGDSVTATINRGMYYGNSVQWYKDGNELPAQSKDTLSIKTAGDYYAVLYDPCASIHLESNHLKVDVITAPVFTFNYPDKIPQCGTTPLTLKTDDNAVYHYRWYTNGVLNGDTTSSYVVTQTGKYKVEVSACTNSWVPSKEVEVDLITLPIPKISTDKTIYCAGDVASLTVNMPLDNSYTINWYRDGDILDDDKNLTTIQDTTTGTYTVSLNSTLTDCSQTSAGYDLHFTPAPYFVQDLPDTYRVCGGPLTITSNNPAGSNYRFRWYTDGVLNGDTTNEFIATASGKYRMEMSSCAGSWVSSHEMALVIVTLPKPTISADKPVYCVGDNATLTTNVVPDASYTISWYRDKVLQPAYNNQTAITTSVGGNYTVLVINNTQDSDGSACSETSDMYALTFNPPATLSIEEIVKTTICDGQTINLLAHYTGGAIKWSTGETTGQINVTKAGKYTATVTTAAGCTKDTSVTVTFLPDPVFSVKDTSVCPYKGQPVTLTAPDGFAQYAWNGVPGGQTYQVTQPQTVALTVTDANGCQTTLPIHVADHCPDIWIPNTFTPNGDGVNDTWVIEGLDGDPSVTVSVFTRYGGLIFKSKGYGTPWNGQYQGKKLPAGVYYYLINAKNGAQKFSGPLTIIY